jgi:hypothetical protein
VELPQLLDDLAEELARRGEEMLQRFEKADRAGNHGEANAVLSLILRTPRDQEQVRKLRQRAEREGITGETLRTELIATLRKIRKEADTRSVEEHRAALQRGVASGVAADSRESRLARLDYLQTLSPQLRRRTSDQPFPGPAIDRVLSAFELVKTAYKVLDAAMFEQASGELFRILRETTDAAAIDGIVERHPTADINGGAAGNGDIPGRLGAAHAWGRFWGWDPKEVGALVALVCYVVPLHARYAGWVKDYGLAVWAVLSYGAIIVSWYVLNFVLAAGMDSYGFGLGGGPWVLLAALANLEWLFVASILYRRRCRSASGGEEGQQENPGEPVSQSPTLMPS